MVGRGARGDRTLRLLLIVTGPFSELELLPSELLTGGGVWLKIGVVEFDEL